MKHTICILLVLAALASATLVAFVSFLAPEVKAGPGLGILLGTDANGGNLIIIDPSTGAAALVGSMGIGVVPSLAVDPTTGIIYAGRGGGLPVLYTFDPVSGRATPVGNTGLGLAAIGALDFNLQGTLYAAVNTVGAGGTGSDHLATINKVTGVATVIGPFGTCSAGRCTIEGIEAIAFDAIGTLWGALSARGEAGAPGLYTINPTTGAASFVAPILDASGQPPSGGVVSLQFACDGTLFGGTARTLSRADDGGRLIIIDPRTGLFQFVGTVPATTQGRSLGALAFPHPCQ